MLRGVYEENGIGVRNHCGAEPPCDIEPPGLVTTVGGRDRASTSYAAADRVKAPASAARGRFRGIHSGRTAPSLPAEAGTTSGGRCLAGSVPPVLVRSRRCSRTPPRPHGLNQHERKGQGEEDNRSRGEARGRLKPAPPQLPGFCGPHVGSLLASPDGIIMASNANTCLRVGTRSPHWSSPA